LAVRLEVAMVRACCMLHALSSRLLHAARLELAMRRRRP
jgi:hypothetical protein